MATFCTGVSATWATVPFVEVRSLKVTHGGSLPLSRNAPAWTLDYGTIEMECLSRENISQALWGLKGNITIAGGGLSYSADAVLEKFTIDGTVNDGRGDIARYTVTLRVQG